MIWVRSKVRGVAWLALFALALQLVLSFGHAHRSDFGLSAAAASSAGQHYYGSAAKGAPAFPTDRGSTSDDGCAICASIALAGTLILAPPPVLTSPTRVERIAFAFMQADLPRASARISFQARGPPAV